MRTIRYTVLPGIGSGEFPSSGTLTDLAREIPYLLVWGGLPPVRVLNEILFAGTCDAGMSGGCRWEPFEVSAGEHEELAECLGMPVMCDAPGWVRSRMDWTIWMMEVRQGVPSGEHRRLNQEYEEAAYREARGRAGEDEPLERYAVQAEMGRRLSEFVDRHVRSSA